MSEITLLIVDDEQAIITLFRRRLEKQFSRIVAATSGEMALVILKDLKIDVLITDVNMSGIDGCELVTRAIKIQPMLQSIVITGQGGNEIAIGAMSAGASNYLQKPINHSELTIAIKQCLEKRNLLLDRQKNQKQLAQYRDHLEELVAKRTLDLTAANYKLHKEIEERKSLELSLRKSTELAENANRVTSEFLANMNHEIRTPMTSAIGLLGLVLETELLPKQKKYLTMARISIHAIHNLLNDILDYSKIEAGRLNMESIPFSPAEIIASVVDLQYLHAEEQASPLTSYIADDVPASVLGDPNRLRQIILNLVSNAIKATRFGEISIECKCAVQETRDSTAAQQAVTLHIFVKDTGKGINKDTLQQIVEIFSQEDTAAPQESGTIGLGLNICSKLVSKMGGHIWVESTPELGATFHFTARFDCTPVKQKAEKTIRHHAPLSILVAEDNRDVQLILQELLEYEGYMVSQAFDGVTACQKITGKKYDVVLLDLNMPEMDGFEVAKEIRRREKNDALKVGENLKIIALTGFTDEESQQKCRDAGMDGFLNKPFTQEELVAKIKEYVPVQEFPPPMTLEGDIFDEEIALENVSGDQELLAEQMKEFFHKASHCLKLLGNAVAGENVLVLEEEIQNVKDLAIKMGAISFADELFSLLMELRKTQGVNDDICKQIDGLEAEFHAFKRVVVERNKTV